MKIETLLESFNPRKMGEMLNWSDLEAIEVCKTIDGEIDMFLEAFKDGEDMGEIKDFDDFAAMLKDVTGFREHPCYNVKQATFKEYAQKYFPNEVKKIISLSTGKR